MFYIKQDNEIVLKDNNLQTITFARDNAYPQYKELPILETDKNIIEFEGKFYFEDDKYYLAESLKKAKKAKYNEANNKAKEYLENGEALFEFEEGKHIEATDGNIAKLTAYALAFVTGQLQPTDTVVWNTKEDETVELNQEQIATIIAGLGQVQATVWAVKFPYYTKQIEDAITIEEVNAIVINYEDENV